MTLRLGPNTFTTEDLLQVWRTPLVKISRYGHLAHLDNKFNQGEKLDISAEAICKDLFAAASNPVNHLTALNESFDSIYQDMHSFQNVSEELVSQYHRAFTSSQIIDLVLSRIGMLILLQSGCERSKPASSSFAKVRSEYLKHRYSQSSMS